MVYGTPQAGFNGPPNQGLNISSIVPGESVTLFSGTESPVLNTASVSCARGYSPGAADNGITFTVKGATPGATVDVQVADTDVAGDYFTIATITADANGNGGATDTGRNPFYRVVLTSASTMPVVTAQR